MHSVSRFSHWQRVSKQNAKILKIFEMYIMVSLLECKIGMCHH